AQQSVSHTHQVMERLDATLANSLELDLPLPDSASAKRDAQTIAKLDANLSEIQALTLDNPKQQRALSELDPLIHSPYALHLNSPAPPGTELATKSRDSLDQIRFVLLKMRQEEERLEGERLRTVRLESRMARFILAIGYTVALIALALTGLSVVREL